MNHRPEATAPSSERSRPGSAYFWWGGLLLASLLAGMVAVRFGLSLFRWFGELGTVLLILVVPAVLLALFFAMRQAARHAGALWAGLTWYHWLWALLFVSALVFRVRNVNDIAEEPLDAWAVFRVCMVGLVGFILLVRLGLRRTPWFEELFRGIIGLLAIYCMFCLISTAWSVHPPWTLYKSLEFLIDISLVAAVVATISTTDEFKSLFDWTWALYGLLLISVFVGAVLWPELALYQSRFQMGELGARLYGVIPAVSANDVGTFGAILALLAICRLLPVSGVKYGRAWYAFLLMASLVALILSQTRSAMAGLLFGIFLFLIFSGRAWVSAWATFVVTPLIALTGVGGLLWSFLQRRQAEWEFLSLTGRLDWWTFAWEQFLERPFTGFGAYAGGRFAVMAQLGRGGTSTMHSDYLEILIGTGLWGLVPVLLTLIATWWVLICFLRHPLAGPEERQLTIEALSILGILTVRSVFMTMLTWHPALNFLVILGFAEHLRRRMNWAAARVPSSQAIRVPAH